jgi:DNA-binding NtrC family response regulator
MHKDSAAISASILIVDDETNVRLMYRAALAGKGYELFEASSGVAALEETKAREHDLIILDLRMPGMDGFQVLEEMQARGVTTPAIFVSAYGDVPNAVRAMKLGAIDFLPKPPTPDQLRTVVDDILSRHLSSSTAFPEKDCDYYVGLAKRAINLRDFDAAKQHLIKALDLDPNSTQAIHLVGVMIEMRAEHEESIRANIR